MEPHKEEIGDWYDHPRPIDLRYPDGEPINRSGIESSGQRRILSHKEARLEN
jgi:acyl-CoA thioesterase-2